MAGKVWRQKLSKMQFAAAGGAVKWFPGHMFSATRAIRDRLKLADLVVEVRDARIPISSTNDELQKVLSHKRRIIALNKKDLANPNILRNWIQYFESVNQDIIAVNALVKSSVKQLLSLVEFKLKEVISREPTLLVMVVGVPNVGKSALINSIHRIALSRSPEQKIKRAAVGPLPGVTQDIAGFKIAHRPSIYVLDTPGILVPSIQDMETGLKLALTGAVKDSVVGEERLAQYLLAILNTRGTPLHWRHLVDKPSQPQCSGKGETALGELTSEIWKTDDSDLFYVERLAKEVARTLYLTLSEFEGDLGDEGAVEELISVQLAALQRPFKISHKSSKSARDIVSRKLLMLFRSGKLGPFVLDEVPGST